MSAEKIFKKAVIATCAPMVAVAMWMSPTGLSATTVEIPDGADLENVRDAGVSAITNLLHALPPADGLTDSPAPDVKRVAIIAINDIADGYFESQLFNNFTTICGPKGYELYTKRDGPEYMALVEEFGKVEGNAITKALTDPATIQKMGMFKDVEAILFARLWGISQSENREIRVRYEAKMVVRETAQGAWGMETVGASGGVSAGTIQLASAEASISEAKSQVTVTVLRMNGMAGEVSANYATSDGSALGGADYSSASGAVTWADGDSSSKEIKITLTPDQEAEGNESFKLTLSAVTGGAELGEPLVATITIVESAPETPASKSAVLLAVVGVVGLVLVSLLVGKIRKASRPR